MSGRLKFLPSQGGPLRVWTHPLAGRQYVIGVDVAEYKVRDHAKGRRIIDASRAQGDSSAACVLDLETAMLCAMYSGTSDTSSFGIAMYALGIYYNSAVLAVEVSGPGRGVQDFLTNTANYPNCWINMDLFKVDPTNANEFGWKTTIATRPVLVKNAQEMIADPGVHNAIPDAELLREMQTMEWDREGKPRGVGKNLDDRVFAWMIALEVRRQTLMMSSPLDEDDPYAKVAPKDREFRRRLDVMRERDAVLAGDADAASWE